MIPHKTMPDLITALLRGDVDVVFEYEACLGAMMTDPRVAVVAYTGPSASSTCRMFRPSRRAAWRATT